MTRWIYLLRVGAGGCCRDTDLLLLREVSPFVHTNKRIFADGRLRHMAFRSHLLESIQHGEPKCGLRMVCMAMLESAMMRRKVLQVSTFAEPFVKKAARGCVVLTCLMLALPSSRTAPYNQARLTLCAGDVTP